MKQQNCTTQEALNCWVANTLYQAKMSSQLHLQLHFVCLYILHITPTLVSRLLISSLEFRMVIFHDCLNQKQGLISQGSKQLQLQMLYCRDSAAFVLNELSVLMPWRQTVSVFKVSWLLSSSYPGGLITCASESRKSKMKQSTPEVTCALADNPRPCLFTVYVYHCSGSWGMCVCAWQP